MEDWQIEEEKAAAAKLDALRADRPLAERMEAVAQRGPIRTAYAQIAALTRPLARRVIDARERFARCAPEHDDEAAPRPPDAPRELL